MRDSPLADTPDLSREVIDGVGELMHLAIDLCLAYGAAIPKVAEPALRQSLVDLDHSHDRFRVELSDWMLRHGLRPPERSDLHGIVERARVVVGKFGGDEGLLGAMEANEAELRSATTGILMRTDLPAKLRAILERSMAREVAHGHFYREAQGQQQ